MIFIVSPATGNPKEPERAISTHTEGVDPRLLGSFTLEDGTRVKPAFQLLKERVDAYTPEWAAGITGIPAATIRRLAHEMGVTARDQKIELYALGSALALILFICGLVASFFHLDHPNGPGGRSAAGAPHGSPGR